MTAQSVQIESVPILPARQPAHWLRTLLRQPRGATASGYLLVIVMAGCLADVLSPYPADRQDLASVLQGPTPAHLLGTDALGRDVVSRLLHGILPSLENSLIALVVFLAIGVPVGILIGYLGGRLDSIVGRAIELLMAIPAIILVLVVLAVFSSSPEAAMITFGVLAAPGLARVVRGATLQVREDLYVTAATVAGVRPSRIMATHVFRRVLGPVLAQATVFAGVTLAVQAALAFLGLLSSNGQPTWGGMIADASQTITQDAWVLFPPGIVLALTVLAFGLLGDTIRDVTSGNGNTRTGRRRTATAAIRETPPTETKPVESGSRALLDVRHLEITAHSAEPVVLVDDVSFTVEPGDIVAVVGESGCGKSMTALGVLGLVPDGVSASDGRILFAGEDLREGGAAMYKKVRGGGLGYVPQDALGSLDPSHTVGSHLTEVIALQGQSTKTERRARAIELLQQVRIPDPDRVLRSYPHQLSGGMAQRVNIALALAGRPRLLIADEPTTALDVTVQSDILRLLRELRDTTGMAIVIITHNWGVVADIADRAVVMYAGQIVESADVDSLFAHPRFPYSAALLQADPSRAVPGTPLPTVSGRVPPPGSWPSGCRFASRCQFAREECLAGPIQLGNTEIENSVTRCIRVDELITEGTLH